MEYPPWWERLLAALIDGVILGVVAFIISAIFKTAGWNNATAYRILNLVAWLIITGLFVGYKLFFEAGSWHATPGKMVFGLKVVDDRGSRPATQAAAIRTWPWWSTLVIALGAVLLIDWLFAIIVFFVLIGIFCSFFIEPVGRCIHDKTAALHVVKAGAGMINIQVNTGRQN